MAVRTVDPQLTALYERFKRPLGELSNVDLHSLSDRSRALFNERLWQHIRQINDKNNPPPIPTEEEFQASSVNIWNDVQKDIYGCSDPDRLSFKNITAELETSAITISPVNFGEQTDLIRVVVTVAISTYSLSPREQNWIVGAVKEVDSCACSDDASRAITLAIEIGIDSIDGVDSWLPPRILLQIFNAVKLQAHSEDFKFQIPWSIRWNGFKKKYLR